MTEAEKAYEAAEAAIARAIEAQSRILDFRAKKFNALQSVPPSISQLTQLKILDINHTQVSDISLISHLPSLKSLMLSNSKVSDISPILNTPNLEYLTFSNTPVADLTPLLDFPVFADPSKDGKLFFQGCLACENDAELKRISLLDAGPEQGPALFAYLNAQVAAKSKRSAPDSTKTASVPNRKLAPVEVVISETRVSQSTGRTPVDIGVDARAADGWEALKEHRDDFAGAFNIGNYAPLPKYLEAFDRVMGDTYDPARAIRIGVQINRLARLAKTQSFTECMPNEAAGDFRGFAAAGLTYVERFPDWVKYRSDAEIITAEEVLAATPELEGLRDVLNGTPEVDRDVADEYAAEIEDLKSDDAGDIEAKAINDSTYSVTREVLDYETNRLRTIQKKNHKLAKQGGDFIDGLTAPFGVPYHLAKRFEPHARSLADKFPNRFGWLATWYDLSFGEDTDDPEK